MKTYTTPIIKTKEIQLQQMIAASREDADSSFSIKSHKGNNTEDLSTSRRGSWGDLWSSEDGD